MTSQSTETTDPQALLLEIGALCAAHKFAEAVVLGERYVEATEAQNGAESLNFALALIELADLLIGADRPAEAEPLLQRALVIAMRHPGGEPALREKRFSRIDTGRLVQSVPALRELVGYVRDPHRPRMYAREPYGVQPPRGREEAVSAGAAGAAVARPGAADVVGAAVTLGALRTQKQAEEVDAAIGGGSPEPTPQEVLSIEAGRLAYQIPNQMWVGVQETVEVRLGPVIANEIMQGFVGRGDVKEEHVPIVETMSVSLVCQPGTFDIEPRSKDAQLVKPDLVKGTAFHQQDFAKWIWLITPRKRGKHTLFVKVSAAIKDSRGLPTTSSLPDKIIAVTVSVHLVRAAVSALRYIAPLVVSGVITALVGVFTKDYWWPAVRAWLGW